MRKQAAEKKTRAQTRDSNEKKMEIKMIMRAQNSQMKIRWRNGEKWLKRARMKMIA